MRKNLKKLISLVVCFVFLMTLAPIAMAAGDEADIAELNIEDILNHQPANMVTEALSLSNSYTWTASPEGVVDTSTGAVTRHAIEDKTVTLTATKDGVSESFTVVVKSKTTKVIAADNFAYNYAEGTNAMAQEDFIFTTHSTTDSLVHPIETETDGNSYLKLDWTKTSADIASVNNYRTAYLRNAPTEELAQANELYFSFKFKYINRVDNAIQNYKARLQMDTADGTTGTNMATLGNNSGTFRIASVFEYDTGYAYSSHIGDATDNWELAVLKYDVANNTVSVSKDGVNFSNAVKLNTTFKNENHAVTNFRFTPPNSKNQGQLLVDDFVIYTESFDNLTEDDIKDYIESETSLDSITSENAGAITGNLNLSDCNGMVEWTTSDANVIAADGTVKRADNIFKSAVLTATYTAGEETVTKKYNFAVAPKNTAETNIALRDNFEAGVAGESITIRQAVSGENYTTFSGWGKRSNDTLPAPEIEYAFDENKGMVGKFSDTADEKTSKVSLFAGVEPTAQRFATGFDVKLDNGESLTFEMLNAYVHHRFVITNNSITVSVDTEEETFAIAPDANGWIRIDVDSNWVARSQNVYVNGVAVTALPLKNMIYTAANNTDATKPTGHLASALRWFDLTVSDGAEVLVDNIAVTLYSSGGIIRTDAAVKAAQLFYSGNEVEAKTLETQGPGPASNNVDISGSFANQGGNNQRATLTWSGDAVENNVFNPTTLGNYTLNVTAKYSDGTTATGTVTVKGAPVVMKVADGKVSAVGNTEGGTLYIAEYDANGVIK
ncbi:MAG: hypothetical protein E7406_00860, partial [Ruminococcaceae bacterium]|nr:hypothetical protein [Oscillospiraceae bacterium]